MKRYTSKEILDRVQSLHSWTHWPEFLDVWIRAKDRKPDSFPDTVHTFHFSATQSNPRPVRILTASGTSTTGQYGLTHYEQWNARGCAVLASNVIVYDSHRFGWHNGTVPAYVQNKPFPYYRDGDRDKLPEELGPRYNTVIGANCHPAGTASTLIGKWSVACLVRNKRPEFNRWLHWLNKRPLSIAILTEF